MNDPTDKTRRCDRAVNDDTGEKEYLVRLLGLFYMLQRCGNTNFVDASGKATREFGKIHDCKERLRTIGIALHKLDAPITPGLVSWCDYILIRHDAENVSAN